MKRASLLRSAVAALVLLVAGAAQGAPTADGRIVYSVGGTQPSPQHRAYTASSNGFGTAAATLPGAAESSRFFVERVAPTRSEHVAGYVTSGGVLYVLRWNGSAWSAEWNVTVGGDGLNGRRFDIAYENGSGRAVVVYSTNGSGATAELAYRIWDGTSWTAPANIQSARIAGVASWVKLLPRPASNEIALTFCDNGTTTGNNADLSSMIWSGTAWGNEPGTAHSTSMYVTTGRLVQNDLFDMAWETSSGTLWVFWTQSTPQQYRRSYAAGTWGTSTSFATGRAAPLQMVAASDPLGDNVLVAFNRSGSSRVYAAVGSSAGGFTIDEVTPGTPNGATTATNRKQLAAQWLVSGGTPTPYPVVLWVTSTAGTLGYNRATVSGTTPTWGTAGTRSFGTVSQAWLDTALDPRGADTLLLTYADTGSDLWAKRLVFVGATPTWTWTDADGGTALTTTLASTGSQNFSFAYDRYVPPTTTVSNGTNPSVTSPVAPGSAAQAIDAFDVQVTNGTDSITAVEVTFAAGTAQGVGLVEVTNASGTTVHGSATNPADVQAITLGTAIPSTATLTSYRIRVTPRAHATMPAPQGAAYSVTARITDVTVTGLRSVNDSASSTLVIDNASSPNVTGVSTTGGDGSLTVNWTNPGAGTVPGSDFAGYMVVLGNSVAVTAAPAEGTATYAPGTVIGSDAVVCSGNVAACVATGLGDSSPFHFRVFTRDGMNNWSTGVAASGTSLAGPTHAQVVYSDGSTTPQARGYWRTTDSFATAAGTSVGAAQTFIVDRASPTRKEHLAGYVTTTGQLYVLRWNGTAWSNEWNVTVGGNGVNGRRFDIAYENASGDAVVAYSTNANGQIAYRVWNGSAWSGATSQSFARLTAPVNAIKLATRALATSDVVAATASDTSNNLSTLVWSGSAWGNEPAASHDAVLGGLAGTAGQNDLWDQAFETASGDLLVVMTLTDGTNYQQYRRSLSGGTWGASSSFGGTGRAPPMQLVAAADPDPASDRVLLAWDRGASANNYATVWSGTGLATLTNVGTGTNPAINQRSIACGWLSSGGTSAAVVVHRSATAGDLGYNFTTDGGTTWAGAQAFSPSGTTVALNWLALRADPLSPERGMLVAGDGNGDLWGKSVTFDGTALTWADADGGTALTATLASTTTQNFDFAFDRYVPPAGTMNLADNAGTEASSADLCAAGSASADIDRFTLLATAPTNVTGITATFNADPSGLVGLLEVTNDAGAAQGSLTNPAGLTPAVTGMTFAAPIGSAAQHRLRVTPLATATGSGSFTARVTAVTNAGKFPLSGTDGTSATIRIDGAAAPQVTGASATSTPGTVTANWTNPAAGAFPATDFGSYVVVLGNTVAVTGAPAKGTATYSVGATVGADTVVCVVSPATPGGAGSCAKSGLGSLQAYHLKIFTRDGCANWSAGVAVTATTPNVTTTIADGANPASSSRAPGGAEAPLDAFTFQANTGTDTVTALTLTLAVGTSEGLASVRIMGASNCGGTQYGVVTNPASEAVAFTGLSIPVTTTATPFFACVTPRSHAAMPSPPGSAYLVTGTVTAFTGANPQVGSDGASATVTIDNASSPNVTAATASGGAGTVTANWTNPGAGAAPTADFGSYVVVLGNAVPVTAAPAEGTASYSAGATLGADTVVCAGSITTCQKSGLGAGQPYHMRIFTRDTVNNWSTGVAVSAMTTDARTTPVDFTATAASCTRVDLSASYTGDTPTSNNRVTFARSAAAAGPFTNLGACSNLGGGSNPRTCSDLTVSAEQSYWYRATFADADGLVGPASLDSGDVFVPACAVRLSVSAGTPMPPGDVVPAGSSGTPVARISLTPAGGSLVLASIAFANTGTAVADFDVASLSVHDETAGVFLGNATWNAATSRYELAGIAHSVGTGRTLRVELNVAPGATADRTFALQLPAGAVTVLAPNLVDAYTAVDGDTFTIVAGTGEGNPNSAAPMVAIVNPMVGAVVSGDFKVQLRVHNPVTGIPGVTSVQLSTDGGATWGCTAAQNSRYATKNASVFECLVSGLEPGPYTLRARATNAVPLTTLSGPVLVTVNAARRGDGNLLVRDNSSQLCSDCHASIRTHSSEVTSNAYGAWAANCRDCHRPHGTRNISLVAERITPPAVNGPQPSRRVGFTKRTGDSGAAGWDGAAGRPTAAGSYVNSDGTGPCQICHTRTTDPNDTGTKVRFRNSGNDDTHYAGAETQDCTDCHSHSNGFAAGEPLVPGAKCGGCHKSIMNMVKTGGQANAHRIDLDQGGDTSLDWSGQATLSAVPSSQRTCLNMCHSDHPHDLTSPVVATHEGNVYADPLTNASRATASATRVEPTNRARTDFDPVSNAGLCAKCHAKPVAANGVTVDAARYGASAHDYTANTAGATWTWTYPLHDGSTFARNCTKCHATPVEGTTPSYGDTSTRALQTVHGSANASLLAGTKNPNGAAAGYVCYNCHGSTATPAAGAQGNRSGKNVQAQAAKTSRHNVNADAIHSSETEFSGAFPLGTMHVSCMDCHDVHSATAANPLANAPGMNPTNSATPGALPTAYTFTRVTDPDNQYQTCFRCHSDKVSPLPTGTTNAAIPFNPANESLHYVEGDKGAVPVNTGTGKGIWQNAQFNLAAVPGQGTRRYVDVMMPRTGVTHTDASLRSLKLRCSDCHGDDAADGGNAVAEGPHGSTRARLLKTPAGSLRIPANVNAEIAAS